MSRYALGLAIALAAALPATSHAQQPQNDTSSRDKTYLLFQVDQGAKRKSGPVPKYPDRLRAAGVEGKVLVQFVVNERGRPEMASFKVLKSVDAELSESVRQAVRETWFTPAEQGGQKVKQLVQMPFTFAR